MDGHADIAALLRDDDGDGVRFLRNAEARTVAGAVVLGDVLALGEGQDAARRLDPAVTQDDRAVMQGRVFEKQVLDKLGIGVGVHNRAGADDGREGDVSFKDQQRPGFGGRHVAAGLRHLADGAGHVRTAWPDIGVEGAAHALEQAAQLRLEEDHQGDHAELDRLAEDEVYHDQAEELRQPQCQQHQDQALCQIDEARLADKPDRAVDQVSDNDDINKVGDAHCRHVISCAGKCTGYSLHMLTPYPYTY